MPKKRSSPSPPQADTHDFASQPTDDDISESSSVTPSESSQSFGLPASKQHEMVLAAVETLKAISDKNNSLLEKTCYRNLREAASLYLIQTFRNAGVNEAGYLESNSPSMVSMRSRSATPQQKDPQ